MLSDGACRVEHRNLPPGHPARISFGCDGRSPDSRVKAPPILPGPLPSGVSRGRSPLTVAGAVTDLAPAGDTAPCSLFSLLYEAKKTPLHSEAQILLLKSRTWQEALPSLHACQDEWAALRGNPIDVSSPLSPPHPACTEITRAGWVAAAGAASARASTCNNITPFAIQTSFD